MVALVAPRTLHASAARRSVLTLPVAIDPQASRITLTIPRSTTANPRAFPATATMRVAIVVDVDGTEYRTQGQVTGGINRHHVGTDREAESEAYTLSVDLPMGYFGESSTDPMEWVNIRPRRLGETAKSSFRAWVEIERVRGTATTEFRVDCDVEPAPTHWKFHHSIAYDTATAVSEGSGDGDISTSFTAGAGSDRAAMILCGHNEPNSRTHSVTWGGSAPATAVLWDVDDGQWSRSTGWIVLDSEIGSGAKTVALTVSSTVSTGSGFAVVSFSGVDQTTPVGTAQEIASTSSGTATRTVTSVNATDVLVDGLSTYGGTGSAGANQTQRATTNNNGFYLATSTQSGADGGVMSYGATSGEYSYGAIALKEASGGGATTRRYSLSLTGVG